MLRLSVCLNQVKWLTISKTLANYAMEFITVVLEQYFKQHPTTKFNKTPSAKYILL
jgi:hypothetical protein